MKYVAPEMKVLAFAAEEEIAAAKAVVDGSNIYNDAEFGGW